MKWKITAWVKDSPNIDPIAVLETRLWTLASRAIRLMEREGFRVGVEEIKS